MNAKIPKNKTWEDLTQTERIRIVDKLGEIEERDMQRVLDVYMKMTCISLANGFGFDEDKLILFLENYKRIFKRARMDVMKDVQDFRLNEQLDKIFKTKPYPDDIFEHMFEGWAENVKGRMKTND